MHFKRTAHLGALHVEGGQLPAVGLLLERRPEVKVHGSHTQVDSNLWERKFHDVQIQCSEKSGSKRWSFKEVTKDTGNWCERRSRWNMDEIAITISDEEHGNCFFFFFHLDCRYSPHRSQSWTIELTSLDSSWWDCYMEWFFCLKTSVLGVSFFCFTPMQMSGTTGSGKSLILETLQKRGEQVWKSDFKDILFVFCCTQDDLTFLVPVIVCLFVIHCLQMIVLFTVFCLL